MMELFLIDSLENVLYLNLKNMILYLEPMILKLEDFCKGTQRDMLMKLICIHTH